jgi:hypothetical protein
MGLPTQGRNTYIYIYPSKCLAFPFPFTYASHSFSLLLDSYRSALILVLVLVLRPLARWFWNVGSLYMPVVPSDSERHCYLFI